MKRRLELKNVDKSGTSCAVVDKARKELNAYSFLFWLNAYLKPRRTRSKKAKKMKAEVISVEEKQISILNRMDSELKEDELNKLKDKEYLYGQSIAAEIRKQQCKQSINANE